MLSYPKVAVIGSGYWGKNLVRNFAKLEALAAVCDSDSTRLAAIKTEFNVAQTFENTHDVFTNPDIQAVVIATPAVTHYTLVKEALLAGKDVFVEKPLALSVPEAEELAQLAESQQRILMVDHLLRYHPAVAKLKELIDNGRLGKLQYIYSNRLNIGKLRNEENILWSFAPHDISLILHLVQQQPVRVEALGEAYLLDNIYDTTITHLMFPNRITAHIYVSWLHPYKEQRLVVIGSGGMAVFDDTQKVEKLVFYPHKIEWIKQVPVANKAEKEVIPVEDKEPLREACLHFLSCVESRQKPKTDGWEGLSVLKILNQAQLSLDKNHHA